MNVPKFTVVFTDSGLGGLSSLGKFYHYLKDIKTWSFKEIDLIFFNALAESGMGYSLMKSEEQKVSIFNSALEALQERYNPDVIAIACNTLSALYPKTAFSKTNKHVLEIISPAKLQISEHQQICGQEPLLIFATETTINSGAYRFNDKNIITVCGGSLASLIEANSKDLAVQERINEMFKSAREKIVKKKDISIFLGCTHYGYIQELFYKQCKFYNFKISKILDPQDAFVELIKTKTKENNKSAPGKTKINLRIESQATIEPYEIKSISALLENEYPDISEILKNYTRLPKMF